MKGLFIFMVSSEGDDMRWVADVLLDSGIQDLRFDSIKFRLGPEVAELNSSESFLNTELLIPAFGDAFIGEQENSRLLVVAKVVWPGELNS